jgi:hypothetical protein
MSDSRPNLRPSKVRDSCYEPLKRVESGLFLCQLLKYFILGRRKRRIQGQTDLYGRCRKHCRDIHVHINTDTDTDTDTDCGHERKNNASVTDL